MPLKKLTFCIVNKVFAFFDSESVRHIICILKRCYYFCLCVCMYICVWLPVGLELQRIVIPTPTPIQVYRYWELNSSFLEEQEGVLTTEQSL